MTLRSITLAILLFGAGSGYAGESGKEYGVYEYVVNNVHGTFAQASARLAAAAPAGWSLLAQVECAPPAECAFRATVFAYFDSAYARRVMLMNRKTGPYAVIDRVNLFEDEQGMHVSVVNPRSILRTVLLDDTACGALAEAHLHDLRTLVDSAVQGEESIKQYGEFRDRGFIGKTMGVMAGGRFDDKVEEVIAVPNAEWTDIAAKVAHGLGTRGKTWGMHLAFRLDLPEFETVILGATGATMESKSFDIVGSGSDDARSDLKCPGLAHAGAYPLEVVVTKDGGAVRVQMVNAMFRMKMYFEDAGNWAFMKHMGMPGSIADELTGQIQSGIHEEAQ